MLILVSLFRKVNIRQTKQNWKKKIPDVTNFVKKTKLTELEIKFQMLVV